MQWVMHGQAYGRTSERELRISKELLRNCESKLKSSSQVVQSMACKAGVQQSVDAQAAVWSDIACNQALTQLEGAFLHQVQQTPGCGHNNVRLQGHERGGGKLVRM